MAYLAENRMVNAKSIQFPLFILEAFSVQQALIPQLLLYRRLSEASVLFSAVRAFILFFSFLPIYDIVFITFL